MITQISLQNVATFGSEVQTMSDLKKLNFVFGTNGSGKTTISRVLRAPDDYSSCAIVWENEKRIPCKVYNSDFVAENFRDDSDMPGIFTLGKEELETKNRIQQIQDALRKLESTQGEKTVLLKGTDGNGGKAGELVALEKKYTNKFWEQKQKYDSSPIKFGMEGCLSSKERFRSELLNQFSSNREPPCTFEELSKRAETAFGDSPQTLSEISIPNFVPLLKLSGSPILSKRIVGKEDIDISALIKKLNNSDWVKAGMAYLEKSEGYCPFCQKQVPHTLTEQLSEYFDDAYSEALKELSDLAIRYTSIGSQLLNQLKTIGQQNAAMLDVQTFNAAVTLLEKTIEENKRKIDSKRQNPSNSIVLVDYENLPDELVNLVKDANKKVAEHMHSWNQRSLLPRPYSPQLCFPSVPEGSVETASSSAPQSYPGMPPQFVRRFLHPQAPNTEHPVPRALRHLAGTSGSASVFQTDCCLLHRSHRSGRATPAPSTAAAGLLPFS